VCLQALKLPHWFVRDSEKGRPAAAPLTWLGWVAAAGCRAYPSLSQGGLRSWASAFCSPPLEVRAKAGGWGPLGPVHSRVCRCANNARKARSARHNDCWSSGIRSRHMMRAVRDRGETGKVCRPPASRTQMNTMDLRISDEDCGTWRPLGLLSPYGGLLDLVRHWGRCLLFCALWRRCGFCYFFCFQARDRDP